MTINKTLSLDVVQKLSLDEVIDLYRQGYRLGEISYRSEDDMIRDLDEYIYNLGEYISEKMSIVIPVHAKSEKVDVLDKTLDGIVKTVGLSNYTITLVGTLPEGFNLNKFLGMGNTKFVQTDLMLGDAKNLGAYSAIVNDKPDVLCFMDSHMNFHTDGEFNSKDWGKIIGSYLSDHPNHIVAPSISIYDKPGQRSFGVYCAVEDTDKSYDLKWEWWGSPGPENKPFEVPGLCGCFMVMSPWTYVDTLGYSPPLAIDDREFNIRAWTLGKTFMCLPKLTVGHRFAPGYADFSKVRSTQWGFGHLLTAFLNMDDASVDKMYNKGIGATADKAEAMKMTKAPFWKNMRLSLMTRRVRSAEEYFAHWRNRPKTLSLGYRYEMPPCEPEVVGLQRSRPELQTPSPEERREIEEIKRRKEREAEIRQRYGTMNS